MSIKFVLEWIEYNTVYLKMLNIWPKGLPKEELELLIKAIWKDVSYVTGDHPVTLINNEVAQLKF